MTVAHVRIRFCLSRLRALSWVKAVVLDLQTKGHRFPNLGPGKAELADYALTLCENLADEERPGFLRTERNALGCTLSDLCIFSLYLDAPATSRFWNGDEEYNLALCRVLMRRYDYLKTLLPGASVFRSWVDIVEDASCEPFYATEATLKIRRGMGARR